MNDKVFILNNENIKREEERKGDRYDLLLSGMQQTFLTVVRTAKHVFKSDVSNLFDIYLENIPEEARQYYKCNKCRLFLNRFGSIVIGDEKTGELKSLLWCNDLVKDTTMPIFENAIKAMQEAVEKAPIKRLFLSDIGTLGTPQSNGHIHFSLDVRDIYSIKTKQDKTASKLMQDAENDYDRFKIALDTYSIETIQRALHLLKTEYVFRSTKFQSLVEKFLEIKIDIEATKNEKVKNNIIRLNAIILPEGVKYIKKTVIGEMMDDLASDMSIDDVKRRFNSKVDDGYQRPTEAASRNSMNDCEVYLGEHGLVTALERRFAKDSDVLEKIWEPKVTEEEKKVGLFAKLEAKDDKVEELKMDEIRASKLITFEKFQAKVLPDAEGMEMFIRPDKQFGFCILTSQVHADANPIFKWDKLERRNPVAWYHVGDEGSYPTQMNLNNTNHLYKIKYLTRRPIEWLDNECDNSLRGIMFVIDGCKDLAETCSVSLFPEAIISNLYKYRQVIEQYSRQNTLVKNEDNEQVAGLVLQQDDYVPGYLLVRVRTKLGYAWYNIDRME